MNRQVIAFTGQAGAGKSTAAKASGAHVVKFAGPLKAMMRALYQSAGLTPAEIDRRVEGDLKETPDPILGGKTPRYAMQTLGTEWGRGLIHLDLWTRLWSLAVDAAPGSGPVVADDCRFPNEAAAVRATGGRIVRVVGRGGIGGGHMSEHLPLPHSVTIVNDGTPDDLARQVAELFPR